VLLGKRRVKDGECCAIWDSSGGYRLVEGPQYTCIWNSDVRFLDRYSAQEDEYLRIVFRDGRREHVPGPAAMFVNPVDHQSVVVQKAVKLDASQVIIVYSSDPTSGFSPASATKLPSSEDSMPEVKVQAVLGEISQSSNSQVRRRVVRGPTLFFPGANEWLHEFHWVAKSPTDELDTFGIMGENFIRPQPTATAQNRLSTAPVHHDIKVECMHTTDDLQVSLDFTVTWQLKDVELLLDTTQDPLPDFHCALRTDVSHIVSTMAFEELTKNPSRLSGNEAFSALCATALNCGLLIKNVMFCGYHTTESIKAIHQRAAQERTALQTKLEAAEQEHRLEDLRLSREMARNAKQQEASNLQLESTLQRDAKQAEAEFGRQRQANDETLRFLRELGNQGVDLTAYLVAKESTSKATTQSK